MSGPGKSGSQLIAEQVGDPVLGGAFGFAYVVHREPLFETQRHREHKGWRGWVARSGFAWVIYRGGVERIWVEFDLEMDSWT